MGETQKNWVTHQNGWCPHLNYHLQLKTKEDVGGSGLGLQERKAIHMEMEKQTFGKQMFAGPAKTVWHRVDSDL